MHIVIPVTTPVIDMKKVRCSVPNCSQDFWVPLSDEEPYYCSLNHLMGSQPMLPFEGVQLLPTSREGEAHAA